MSESNRDFYPPTQQEAAPKSLSKLAYLDDYRALYQETSALTTWFTKIFEPTPEVREEFVTAADFLTYLPKASDGLVSTEASLEFWLHQFSKRLSQTQQDAVFNHDLDGAIGDGEGLLYQLPEDMAFFRTITAKTPLLMGRETFVSLRQPIDIPGSKSENKTKPESKAANKLENKSAAQASGATATQTAQAVQAAQAPAAAKQPHAKAVDDIEVFKPTAITDASSRVGWVNPQALPQLQPLVQLSAARAVGKPIALKPLANTLAAAAVPASATVAVASGAKPEVQKERYAKPLPGRLNLVLSRSAFLYYEPVVYQAQEEGFEVTRAWQQELASVGIDSHADALLFSEHIKPAKRLLFVQSQIQAVIISNLVQMYAEYVEVSAKHNQRLHQEVISEILDKSLAPQAPLPTVKDPTRYLSQAAAKGLKTLYRNLCDKAGNYVLKPGKRLSLIGGAQVFNHLLTQHAHPLARIHLLYLTNVFTQQPAQQANLAKLDLGLVNKLYSRCHQSAKFVGNPEAEPGQQLECQLVVWKIDDAKTAAALSQTAVKPTKTPAALVQVDPVALEFKPK